MVFGPNGVDGHYLVVVCHSLDYMTTRKFFLLCFFCFYLFYLFLFAFICFFVFFSFCSLVRAGPPQAALARAGWLPRPTRQQMTAVSPSCPHSRKQTPTLQQCRFNFSQRNNPPCANPPFRNPQNDYIYGHNPRTSCLGQFLTNNIPMSTAPKCGF